MTSPGPDDFDRIISKEFTVNTPPNHLDTNPYGIPAHPHKPGLTKRGKAALGIGSMVLAGGALIGYQAYSADAAASEAKAQEIALQQQRLELEKLKELNKANAQVSTADQTRQASVDRCVKNKEDLVGKGLGAPTYRDVIDACRAQYADTTSGMQTAASEEDSSTGGGLNSGAVIGVGVLAVGIAAAARKAKRPNPS